MNIVLTGFASSGKSATADALYETAGYRHIDLDRVIEKIYEQRHGNRLSCREIFRAAGADGFSAIESDALRSLSGLDASVLSTGGRTPMNADNHPLLKSFGRIVYLKCSVNTILKRMRKKGAPLSIGNSPEEITAEWNRRDPVYSKLADVIIENDTKTPEETARVILETQFAAV